MDRDVGDYDVNLQVMSLSAGKEATDLGWLLYRPALGGARSSDWCATGRAWADEPPRRSEPG
jgi:hypothetical protein